jgi:hypothetical protein
MSVDKMFRTDGRMFKAQIPAQIPGNPNQASIQIDVPFFNFLVVLRHFSFWFGFDILNNQVLVYILVSPKILDGLSKFLII